MTFSFYTYQVQLTPNSWEKLKINLKGEKKKCFEWKHRILLKNLAQKQMKLLDKCMDLM